MKNVVVICLGFLVVCAMAVGCSIAFDPPISTLFSVLGGALIGISTASAMDLY